MTDQTDKALGAMRQLLLVISLSLLLITFGITFAFWKIFALEQMWIWSIPAILSVSGILAYAAPYILVSKMNE
jgi:hypothetical protein